MDQQLVGFEIHGFRTRQDLDAMMEEGRWRWLHATEIHALLCNYKHFPIHAKPVELPPSGTIVMYNRKTLRRFRNDGHNWKKKNDQKTVREHDRRLKVGDEERLQVFYAHGEDSPTFARRCYWLLDKSMGDIVLVHYLDTNPSSSLTFNDHEQKPDDPNTLGRNQLVPRPEAGGLAAEISFVGNVLDTSSRSGNIDLDFPDSSYGHASLDGVDKSNAQRRESVPHDSSENWLDQIMTVMNKSPVLVNDRSYVQTWVGGEENSEEWLIPVPETLSSVDDIVLNSSSISGQSAPLNSQAMVQIQSSVPRQIFSVNLLIPTRGFANESTKIAFAGLFLEDYKDCANCILFCVCENRPIRLETVQAGMYQCLLPPHEPGLVDLFISLDGRNPISQVMEFEYLSTQVVTSKEEVRTPIENENWLTDILFP